MSREEELYKFIEDLESERKLGKVFEKRLNWFTARELLRHVHIHHGVSRCRYDFTCCSVYVSSPKECFRGAKVVKFEILGAEGLSQYRAYVQIVISHEISSGDICVHPVDFEKYQWLSKIFARWRLFARKKAFRKRTATRQISYAWLAYKYRPNGPVYTEAFENFEKTKRLCLL